MKIKEKYFENSIKPGTRILKQLKCAAAGSMNSASRRFLNDPGVNVGALGSSVTGGAMVGGGIVGGPGFNLTIISK